MLFIKSCVSFQLQKTMNYIAAIKPMTSDNKYESLYQVKIIMVYCLILGVIFLCENNGVFPRSISIWKRCCDEWFYPFNQARNQNSVRTSGVSVCWSVSVWDIFWETVKGRKRRDDNKKRDILWLKIESKEVTIIWLQSLYVYAMSIHHCAQ